MYYSEIQKTASLGPVASPRGEKSWLFRESLFNKKVFFSLHGGQDEVCKHMSECAPDVCALPASLTDQYATRSVFFFYYELYVSMVSAD